VTWWKTDQNVRGDKQDLTWATEQGVLGNKKSADASVNRCNMSSNPTERHNVITGPALHKLSKNSEGNVVNQHESPTYVAKWFGDKYTHDGDWVIVCGAGAGGDVRGFLEAGCNVVAIEKDPTQYAFLCESLAVYEATLEQEDKKKQDKDGKRGKEGKNEKGDKDDGDQGESPDLADRCGNCPSTVDQIMLKCTKCQKTICSMCTFDYDDRDPTAGVDFCGEECMTQYGDGEVG
jgi:hypothetical protein